MGGTAASNPCLEVSVSFGRFENDSLSWEKWSAFSPNKYLEEVEKCATPGSVAQKKAYFEAHYKNIAARKAELLAQEKQVEKHPFRSRCQNGAEDLSCNNICETNAEFDMSNTQGLLDGVKQEKNSIGEIIRIHLEEDVSVLRDCQCEGENGEIESRSRSSRIDKPEVGCVEQEESLNIEAEDRKGISHHVNDEISKASKIESKVVTLDHPKVFKKFGQVTLVNKETNLAKTKKKSVLPSSKASQVSTPRSSKPSSTPTKTLASASSTKRANSSPIGRKKISSTLENSDASTKRGNSPPTSGRKITSTIENRKVPSKSLHMSLSLAPSKPDPAPNTIMRKSFIMEKMRDKDIVKRAFKTFQNSFNQAKVSGEDKSLVKEQDTSTATEQRVSKSIALRKENGQSPKVDRMDKRSGNAVGNTLDQKSDIRADTGKEYSRKDVKFYAKEIERMQLQLKSKEEKLKHNSKATSLPVSYRSQNVSKSHSEKGDVNLEKWL